MIYWFQTNLNECNGLHLIMSTRNSVKDNINQRLEYNYGNLISSAIFMKRIYLTLNFVFLFLDNLLMEKRKEIWFRRSFEILSHPKDHRWILFYHLKTKWKKNCLCYQKWVAESERMRAFNHFDIKIENISKKKQFVKLSISIRFFRFLALN